MTIDTLEPFKSSPEPAGPEDGVFVFPASYAQQRLWFLDQLAPGSPVYNLPFAWRLRGPLETRALASAVSELVERHESLRTTFAVEEREPVQVVSPPGAAADLLPLMDLSLLDAEQREAEARQRVAEEAGRPFDLERGPLFRAGLLRLDETDHVLFVTFHHVVSDGWSLAVFQRELSALYSLIAAGRPALLPELPIQYADFSLWQRDFLRGKNLESQLAWWRAALEGAPPVLELPFRPRPAVSGQRAQRGAWRTVAISRRLADALREVGQSEGATRFMTLLAAFEVLLHLCTGQEDLVVGTPVSGRTQVETEGLIGLFVNTLALRTDLAGVSTFRELLARVKESALGAYSHDELPFERLVEELQPERSLAHNPLVQVTFSLQERARDRGLELEGLIVEPWDSGDRGESTAKFDLSLFVEETPEGVKARLDWDAELLDDVEALRLLESYQVLLEGIAEDPWRPLWSLPALPAASRHQLVAEWNDTVAGYDLTAPLHERFAAQAARTPEAIALVYQEVRLTYAELDRRANRLARRLRMLGAGPESRVGVALDRTPELIVALLAVQKAGGAYVPLDPAYPRERLSLILEDAQAGTEHPVLITSSSLLERLPAFWGQTVLLDRETLEGENVGPLPSLAGPRNLAYLIYTSGSTGRPKGVAIEHRSAAALLEWAMEIFTADETVLASTSITFDLSVFEIFLPLTRGGTVVLAENALALPELPSRESVTLVNTVPSAIAALIRAEGLPASVRTVNLAGEPLKRALVNELYAVPTVEAVYNLYGPSEDTTYSTWERVSRDEQREPTIGVPIANTRGYVLDHWLCPLPVGVPGELFLAGAGLARGYLNRPDLTAASFVPDPFAAESDRLYRTGDLARRLPDGRLEFLGRIDHQVKVRGYRIELGEIESHLLAHPGVRDAVVLALGEGEERSLAAFVVGDGDLRSWLETRLPAYMVPSSFIHLDVLPLSPNGKVDRKALAKLAPDREAFEEVAAAPQTLRTAVEELLSGIWADVLRLERVGLHDSFFELGGHSLLATQVVSRAREVFRVDLPLRALFETPTIASLAARVESTRREPAPPIPRASREREPQASFAQERLWFLDRFGTDRASYNLPSAIHLRGWLDVAALAGALSEIVRRHESLRTTFRVTGDAEPRVLQVIGPAMVLALPVVDLSGVPNRREEAARLSGDEARRTFDLSRGPLLRTMLVRTGEDEHTLLLTQHHIVSDGWSIGVLLRELKALYSASVLPELAIQYADFAVWQRGWLQGDVLARQLGWWRDHLVGAPAVLELPADRPRPAVQSARGGRFPMALPAALQEGMHFLARRQGATPFMVLLAAFQALLGRLANREDVVVGTPIAGRNRAEVEGLIGFFVNTLVLRADLAGDPSFRRLLGRSRETILSAYDHQDLPFEKLVEELQPERSLAHTPLFQVMFILQNAPLDALELPGLSVVAEAPDTGTTKFDLRLSLMETDSGLVGSVVYNRDLFDETTLRRLAGHYERLLAAAVADPAVPLAHLPLLGEAQAQQILREWNDSRADWDLDKPLHRWIEAQALRTPDAPALTFEGETINYRELDERAGHLAARLRRLGVGPESRVGIAAERSLDLVTGLLGILKAGGAYVPLDPSYPQERLAFMIEDFQTGVDKPVLLTQDLLGAESAESIPCAAVDVLPEHPAYVIYTSGSTGRPKGAVNTHRAIVNRLVWMQEQYGLTSEDVVLQKTPYSFDVSVWEFFWPLMFGARLVVAKPGGHQDSAYLADLIRREGVTTLHFVPSMLQVFLEQPGVESCSSLRRVICSGEALPYELQQRFFAKLGSFAGLHNLYGPTEAAVDVTVWACDPEGTRPVVPIGRPISNLGIHILDRNLRPAPMGVPGELHIAGVGLARGYLNRPDMTAERFIPDPFGAPGSRLYKTGDLSRHLPDGHVEYLGRLDHQVKIRGFRIELGEIEAALANHPSVKEAVVLAREDRPGDKRIVAYVTLSPPSPGEGVGEAGEGGRGGEGLRRHLSSLLPEYMVPSAFVVLPALPLSPNGKVDRKALPEPDIAAPADRSFVAPRTPLEEHLAELWKAPLGLERIGIHDDFFALGGNSISGAVLINRLQEELGEIVHVVAIFDAPTVERMARHLAENHAAAVERIWGRESLGTEGAARRDSERIDGAKIAQIRALIPPLAPFATSEPKNPPAIFVLAPPRSGTTLLRVLLGGHPRLFAPPELELLSHNTMAERRAAYRGRDSFWLEGLIRAVMEVRGCDPDEAARITASWERNGWSVRRAYRQMQEWLGERNLVDKSPSYAFDLSTLQRAEESFDGALYVHLVRHPGGMIRSFEEARLDQIFFRRPHPFSRRELAELLWLISQENILRFLEDVPETRRHTLRFEDLVRKPEPALRRLCAFLGLDFHPSMLRPYEDRSRRMTDGLRAESRMLGDVKFHTHAGIEAAVADRWREDVAEETLGDQTVRLAVELGYEVRTVRDPAAIPRRKLEQTAPLSFAQERLWFLAQLEPDSPFYNIPAALRLTGSLDVSALERTLSEIRRRHESLRTVFASGPLQIVTPAPAVGLPNVDLSALPAVLREVEVSRLASEEMRRPFDLAAGPLLRTILLRLGAEGHALLVTMHHIVSDGWSLGVFLSELSALYGGARLPELPIQYADFAVWQRERLRGAALDEHLAWWRERLAGAPALLELPTDRPRPAVQRFRGGQLTAGFAADLAERIRSLSQRRSATSFMTLLAGFQALLSAWSGQEDVSVGSPAAGRLWPETEPLIGFFVNTLVFRTRLEPSLSFDELLARVQRSTIEAFAHQEIPFEKIVEELQPERSLAHSPLFQVLFAFQNNPRRTMDLPGLEISAIQSGGGTAKFDLSLSLAERNGRVLGGIEYDADLFDAATAARLLGGLETLLRAAAEEPERRISDLPLLTEAERLQILEWNATGTLRSETLLHELFETQADLSPEAEALICGEERLTYRELDCRANRLAHRLRRLGVGPEVRVGVALERSADLIVALLAILKAGGAYVPLDPAYPQERLALILEDAGCPVVVDRESLLGLELEDAGRLPGAAGPGNLAYLIYTSGSTGRPKGVAIEHRSAAALLAWAEREFEDLSGVLASTSITFDLSVFELFLPLARGGRVILADNALALPDLPARNEVRLINTVPSAIAELVRLDALPESVRTVNLAGEPLKRALAERIYALPHVERVCNLYGPSEDTTYSTWVQVPRGSDREPTIGVPIAGTRAWVMDRGLRPLPVGVPGELCLAGEGLARGYLNRPDLTAASFVPDPFGGLGERLYRTGDLARWSPSGELEFLGRIDHQVKVRGFRIELGEVETALLAHPAVREAVVLALGEGSERRLVAYVVGEAAPADLQTWLERLLPAYMVPAVFVVLDVLPLTPNGKVDRKALARTESKTESASAGPQTAIQELLAGIWSEVLKCGPVKPDDRFFDLGGHSLLATQVVSRAREVFGVELPLRALFETPSLAGLAARIEALRKEGLGLEAPPILPVSRDGNLQASFAQERLWFLDRLGTDRASYNLPTAIHLKGPLNATALAAALSAIVSRHETLRTTFEVGEPGVVQVIGPAAPVPLPIIDLSGFPDEVVRLARNDARRTFDLSRGPLLRAALLRRNEDEHTLLLTQHHIVSDGWSIGVLLRELSILYRADLLADLPVQYADFAVWQRSWLQGEVLERQLGWWRDHLAGAPAVLELPADRPRPPVLSFRGGRFPVILPAELRDQVQALARQQGATPFMVLLAAFQALLGRMANQDDVPVGTPIAGRSRGEVEGLIGFFINTLVLRARLAGDPGFQELLGRTREALLGAYAHQDLPFEKLVEELHPERSLAHSPLFQAMFILQNAPMESLELPGIEASAVVPDTGSTKFDLRLSLTEAREGLVGSVLYSLDLFDATTVLRLAGHFEALLSAALNDPGARLSDLPLLGPADTQQLVREWNDSRAEWDLDRPLHRWIEEQAVRTPDAPALTFEGATITYREMDARAGRLAGRLRRLGVGPETRVGISAERSLELVVGLLGVLKAGGAYVPLDPSYPQERQAFMIEDADPVLLTQEHLDVEGEVSAAVDVLPEHSAYVIYTSGSTGRPKGAINTHRAIVNRLIWMQQRYGLAPDDVVLQKTPYSFDVSVWEFFWPLMVGARLVVARPGGHQDSAYLADLIRREGVTTLHFVPSMLQVFLEQPGVESCTSIRRVICSGEALPYELQQRFFAKLGAFAELHNLYGPTEAAVDVTVWACKPESARPVVPIGRPISNLSIHVLDRNSRPVPIGVPGELHIGGVGLARGYLNRPEMTAERFLPDPLGEAGSRLYRTGDLVRLLTRGEIEYLGRIDFQVKIRGFRIELGEIEAALASHASVKEAVVLAREDRPGDKRLVAYVTPHPLSPSPIPSLPPGEGERAGSGLGFSPPSPGGWEGMGEGDRGGEELRAYLARQLPEYMIPSAFVVLPILPLSPNGKVDRKALPAPETAAPDDQLYVAPCTPLESYLAERWQSSLGLEQIGIHDDFFTLGGNSITGAILVNQLQEKLGEIVHVVVIFDAPTVEQMAAYLLANHARAVERIWGRESLSGIAATRRAEQIDESKVAQIRALIQPLPPFETAEPVNPPAVFVLAPPRSGTTLLRVLLGGHPRLFAPPELELLSHNDMAGRRAAYTGRDSFWLEGLLRAVMEARGCDPEEAARITGIWEQEAWSIRRAYGQLQQWLGDRILVEKTPSYAFDPGILRRAEEDFDGALYIHLVRHPGAVIRSFEEAKLEQIFFRREHAFSRRELAELLWLISHENILGFLTGIPERRRHTVHFEELVREPEPVLRRLCAFLGIDFHPAMLRPYEERSRRMTDGLRAESRMLGDVKFHTHSGIEAAVAERWREEIAEESLGEPTLRLAAVLGYIQTALLSSSIPRRPRKPGEPVPLSFAQERLWFLGQFDPDSSFYNITSPLGLHGDLDVAALDRSLEEIRRRHSVLRTVFTATLRGTVQIAGALPEIGLPVIDLADLPKERIRLEARRVAGEEGRRPFDLARGPMLRTPLLRLGASEHMLVVTMHHIASDGWSLGLLISEMAALYSNSLLAEPPIEYADFAIWQRERLSGEELKRQVAWWRQELTGAPALIQLPADRPRAAVQRFRGSRVDIALPADLSAEVAAAAKRHGATVFMTLLASFQALLSRICGQNEIVIGSPVAGRNWPETEALIGLFVNTLVVRGNLRGDPGFGELLARTRRAVLGSFAHQEVPFEKLVEELQPERSLTHSPIFQVMFALQNIPRRRIELPGLEITAYRPDGGTAKFDLNLLLAEQDGRFAGTLEYNSDLFDATTCARLLRSFEVLLRGLLSTQLGLSAISLLGEAERHQMLSAWNDTEAPFPRHLCLHQLFEAQVAARPAATAVLFEDQSLTYEDLDQWANRLANLLLFLGVGPGRLVAVHMERSPEMIVAVLGILKAGGAYVPIEVSWPADRLRYILESEGIAHVVTQAARLEELPSLAHAVCLDTSRDLEGMPDTAPEPTAGPEDPAYIIFTSGSTGRPKGVMVRHRPAVNLIHWVNHRFGVGPADTLLFVTALSFDLSVYDVFGILAAGGTVRITTPEELRDPAALVSILLHEPITFWDSAPAALQQLVSRLPAEHQAASLRLVFNSGDWIPIALPDRVRQTFPQAEFVSLGGATEATVWSNFFPVGEVSPHWVSIPYGRPIENARYHVLDEGLTPRPIGVPGDLYIAGICLSDGYTGAPELTAQKYVPDPFGDEPGGRLYQTGDRTRFGPDGNLEFLGRIDTQVKVRGFRIELGEIESVLAAHPAVRVAVVLAREDSPGDQRLVAYFIAGGEVPTSFELRRFVHAKLPEYMVPSLFVPMESWPLAATGKLDRKALPPPERAHAKPAEQVLPRNELEKTIADIWKEVVGLAEVGIRDNFFDVGGHSLLMARVHHRLEETLGREVSMVDLFQYPTIASLAAHLSPAAPAIEEAVSTLRAATVPVAVERRSEDIAVIGMAGRFPGAASVEELWRNLRDEVESIRTFTDEELRAAGFGDEILDSRFVKRRGALDGPDLFDAGFFDYVPREAQIIDPQQRLFLECAWEALENAGYGGEAWRQRVGVFGGASENTYVLSLLLNSDLLRAMGRQQISIANNHDYLPTRVSYKLNLRGPSVNVQTACSTSLVAVHLARLSLLRGECEIALAGGVSVKPFEVSGYLFREGGINSPDGHTRAFDARAQGVVGGSGAGIVVLKRLEDALADGDTVLAVIRGSAINNDGSGKAGFTAPSVAGQSLAIREAHRAAGIDPDSITYVEAHGTATPIGDPIEATALMEAFGETQNEGYCALGSIKTNIGHLDAAAGVAGLIKTVLSLQHRTIPASLHFERPNPKIPFEGSPFYVNAHTREWPSNGLPRRAGVSSFGIGGTNAHAVLEEAPEVPASEPSRRGARLLVLSAKTASALEAATANLASWLENHPAASLDDAAFTLQVGRQPFDRRRAVICREGQGAIAALRDPEAAAVTGTVPAGDPTVVFLFPGQGAQYARMGAELYEREPVYRSALDRCCELLAPDLGLDLRDLLHPARGQGKEADRRLAQTALTQPALFAVEYSLARLWASWGLRPAAMLGHSVGEYVAACVAGVFSLEDALCLIAVRGRLMQDLPAGAMLGVSLPEEEVRTAIEGRDVSLAAINAPRACVVSGPEETIASLRAELEARGVETRPLHTSHAFHSRSMDPILGPFAERVRQVKLQAPRLRFLSNVTGTWITAEQATDPEYWARHLRQAVRFADGITELLRLPNPVLLEVGPGHALSTLARQHPDRKAARLVVSSLSHAKNRKPDEETVLGALGRLWVAGVDVDWTGFWAAERRRRIPLPTYPFERRRFWVEMTTKLPARAGNVAASVEATATETPEPIPAGKVGPRNPIEETIVSVWRELLGIEGIGIHDDFFELGGSSLMAVQLGSRLRQVLEVELPVDFLFQASTVAGMAEMAVRMRPDDGRPAERPRSSCLVPIQKGDGRRPLFMVHQVGGNVYTFRVLAQSIGKDLPLYGLRSRGLEDGEEPFTCVEDMAEHYLELLRSVQPAGPYRIGGASMGGMIAFEMAHRLRAAGETVDLLTLMDTPCGEQMPPRRLAKEDIVIDAFRGRVELTEEELLPLSADEQIAYGFEKARKAGTLPEGFNEAGARRLVRVVQSNVAALYSYRPQPYAGRMIFFRAEQRRPIDPPRPEIAWIDLARGGCDVLLVSGNHETMHELPNVLTIAERLRGQLAI